MLSGGDLYCISPATPCEVSARAHAPLLPPPPPLRAHSPLYERGCLRPRRPRAPRARSIAPRVERVESGSLGRRLDPVSESEGREGERTTWRQFHFPGPEAAGGSEAGRREDGGREEEEEEEVCAARRLLLTGNALRDRSLTTSQERENSFLPRES